MKTAVIIPAWNEADRIGATVQAAFGLPSVSEVIVVDDGSGDDTADAASAAGAQTSAAIATNPKVHFRITTSYVRCKVGHMPLCNA